MRPLVVVGQEPALADGGDLCERFEEVGIKDFLAIAAIEAFDVRVLISGLPGWM